jgi:phosphonate transport system substrate-binding protein
MAGLNHALPESGLMRRGTVGRLIISVCSIVVVLAMLIVPGASFASDSFVIGVAPHTSARIILNMYEPLRLHLEKTLGLPVEVITAPDFEEFARRALAQHYDLAITTGHQARLLQTDANYLPLLTYKTDFKAVAIVSADGPVHKPKDLKGKSVLGLSSASLVTMWGQHWLRKNGLGAVPIKYVSASDSVAQLVIAGEAAAGFTSLANVKKLAPNIQSQLRIIAESQPMAGRVYLLNNRQAHRQKVIDSALWDFARTMEGRRYFEENGLGGYRKLKPGELAAMNSYAVEVRRLLQKNAK